MSSFNVFHIPRINLLTKVLLMSNQVSKQMSVIILTINIGHDYLALMFTNFVTVYS
jgi:hypothetical protein